jgi:hypothetical protein
MAMLTCQRREEMGKDEGDVFESGVGLATSMSRSTVVASDISNNLISGSSTGSLDERRIPLGLT